MRKFGENFCPTLCRLLHNFMYNAFFTARKNREKIAILLYYADLLRRILQKTRKNAKNGANREISFPGSRRFNKRILFV